MTCTCSTPNPSCQHARPKVVGYYCNAELTPTTPTELGKLRHGDKFSFTEAEWLINTVTANYGDRIVYQRPDGWKITTEDLDRVVNVVLQKLD